MGFGAMWGRILNQKCPKVERSSGGQEEVKCPSFEEAGDIFEPREKLSLMIMNPNFKSIRTKLNIYS